MSADDAADFETAMARLEQIVQELESPQLALDKALVLFEEGLALGNRCTQLLEQARVKVDQLLERQDGSAEARPFETPEGS